MGRYTPSMSRGGFLSGVKTVVLGTFAAVVIKLLRLTVRWHYVGFPDAATLPDDPPAVFAFWHGRMLMLVDAYWKLRGRRTKRSFMLISRHGDGRLIACAIQLLGIHSVAGSSSRGGIAALMELCRKVEEGCDVGFTPDGPRGPRQECKAGVVAVAQRSGVPIVPMSYSTEKRWQLSSWDGMIVPKPFSRGVVILGEPLTVLPDEDQEHARARVQDALNVITERADRYWDAG